MVFSGDGSEPRMKDKDKMTVELTVGPPTLTINQGNRFMVTDLNGEIQAESAMGIYSHDTRFVSYLAISANGERWKCTTSATANYDCARIVYVNVSFNTEFGVVPENTLSLEIRRQMGKDIDELLSVDNYGSETVTFNLEIALRCDFADIYEVHKRNFFHRGRTTTTWLNDKNELHMHYTNRDFGRRFVYRVSSCNSAVHYANGRVTLEVTIEPRQRWEAKAKYILLPSSLEEDMANTADTAHAHELDQLWGKPATELTTANEEWYRVYRQSINDYAALQLYSCEDESSIVAAGVPWYVTLFGRDSIIASLQAMLVNPQLALRTLKVLADQQANEMDDYRDAEPGKILHEIRCGELAYFKRIPHSPYYGTADATPLYLVLLHETWRWLGNDQILKDYRDTALRCLEWIDKYGDLDGDGFQEYRTRSEKGNENMGWKDSANAIVYPDGTEVKQPKALIELQGYVFDAWMRSAEIFERLGDSQMARDLRSKAAKLQSRFEETFWCEKLGFYALTLDPAKRAVETVASNAGHCLWSGIIRRDRAEKVVRRLFEPDMWTGWGIRTISSENGAYNPHSYHLGSVWPHDNGIIALGFKRYGFADEASRVARDISGAAECFLKHRLPELYAGVERTPKSFPVLYANANAPQAWAAGSVFHLLQAIVGIQADAPSGTLQIDPALPHWLPDLHLSGLSIGNALVNLHIRRDDETTTWDAEVTKGDIDILQKPWQPWVDQLAEGK